MGPVMYTIISVILVSLVSFIGVVGIALTKKELEKYLLTLLSLSVGTLLGGAFLHLLPEASNDHGFTVELGSFVLAGVVVFFIIEKIIHWKHSHQIGIHHHKHHIGMMNLVGDGIHNFLDGLVIAGAYLVSIPVGIATTVAVVVHEIPQEIADFGVLLYSGMSKIKALMYNFAFGVMAVLGALVGLFFANLSENFLYIVIPFAAGGFIYIAGANLIPELHRKCSLKEDIIHLLAVFLGIGIMVGLLYLG
jgi:zinc and cadmium transporter